MSTTIFTDADVDVGEFVEADYEERLVDLKRMTGVRTLASLVLPICKGVKASSATNLESKDLWLNKTKRGAVHFHKTFASLFADVNFLLFLS